MKRFLQKQLLLLVAVLSATITATAYDFEVNGIYYGITSDVDKTCSVTYRYKNGNDYSGSINIPSTQYVIYSHWYRIPSFLQLLRFNFGYNTQLRDFNQGKCFRRLLQLDFGHNSKLCDFNRGKCFRKLFQLNFGHNTQLSDYYQLQSFLQLLQLGFGGNTQLRDFNRLKCFL